MKTKNHKILFLLLGLFFISTLLNAQTRINSNQYNSKKDSLIQLKSTLALQKDKLNSEIEGLNSQIEKLDDSLKTELRSLYILKYGKKIGTNIAFGKIWKGMTEDMLRDSWGKPDKIKKNVEKWGTFTQWYYGKITYFFKNGKMTDWEEKK